MFVAASANASSIAATMRRRSSKEELGRMHIEKDACDAGALDGCCDHRHQCTRANVKSFTDARSRATSTSSTTAIGVPSAAWMA